MSKESDGGIADGALAETTPKTPKPAGRSVKQSGTAKPENGRIAPLDATSAPADEKKEPDIDPSTLDGAVKVALATVRKLEEKAGSGDPERCVRRLLQQALRVIPANPNIRLRIHQMLDSLGVEG